MIELTSINGGITAAQGISACGISAGFRHDADRLDFALIAADKTCTAAGVFTQNVFCAAPVTLSRKNVSDGRARAIIINSGIANAATGEPGLRAARRSAAVTADALGCEETDVLVASTGVIGVQLDSELFSSCVPKAVAALSKTGGTDAAKAIMTTDTVSKEYAVAFKLGGIEYHVGGMAKGSGMIMPNMATMIACITTDVTIDPKDAHALLMDAVTDSFNKVTVDSDTSTNDTCFLIATGEAGGPLLDSDDSDYQSVLDAIREVCTQLARKIARDGEGATKLIDVTVKGAETDEDADLCARAIANSPLVKTAVAGHDANWGRIAAAAGKSGAKFKQENVDIDIMGIPVCRKGLAVAFDEQEALKRFEDDEIALDIDLGSGISSAKIWTCDLTKEYISINADYRS